ncbi:MAG: entericidin A/B family lipoprotein [Candidatus Omnitrophota bacterium]|jgi:predicted small secreted protein
MRKSFLLILTVLFLTTLVLGCNMFRGAGKDIENAGGSIQRTADHND